MNGVEPCHTMSYNDIRCRTNSYIVVQCRKILCNVVVNVGVIFRTVPAYNVVQFHTASLHLMQISEQRPFRYENGKKNEKAATMEVKWMAIGKEVDGCLKYGQTDGLGD